MEQVNVPEFINKEDLIYWIDKQFVQKTAQKQIGRTLSEEEIERFTKAVEFGLWHCVYDVVRFAIDEINENQITI